MARPTLFNHPKFQRLVHVLAMPEPHVLGHLEYLWRVGYASGNPVVGDAMDVEIAAKWSGQPGEFCAALLEVRLIDEISPNLFAIHDLAENAPAYVQSRRRMERWRNERRRDVTPANNDATVTSPLRNDYASPAPAPGTVPPSTEILRTPEVLPTEGVLGKSAPTTTKAPAPQTQLLMLHETLFTKRTGDPPAKYTSADAVNAQRIVTRYGLDRASELLRQFMESTDDFIERAGFGFNIFATQINKLLSDRAEKRPRLSEKTQRVLRGLS